MAIHIASSLVYFEYHNTLLNWAAVEELNLSLPSYCLSTSLEDWCRGTAGVECINSVSLLRGTPDPVYISWA